MACQTCICFNNSTSALTIKEKDAFKTKNGLTVIQASKTELVALVNVVSDMLLHH